MGLQAFCLADNSRVKRALHARLCERLEGKLLLPTRRRDLRKTSTGPDLLDGEPAPYPYPNTLQAYYGHPEWGSQELALCCYLIDATQISDEELLKHGHCAPMALLLKHGRAGNFALAIEA